ncbi:MAG: hypothetical protein RL641_42 [Candidatus Parcubacteria bacterium]|jgi:hypothetical protein
MKKEEFVALLGIEVQSMTQQEIDEYYNLSINLFNTLFNKFKKEKIDRLYKVKIV